MADQVHIAQNMSRQAKELQDLNDDMLNWQANMRKDDQQRRAKNAMLDELAKQRLTAKKEQNARPSANENNNATVETNKCNEYKTEGNECFKRSEFDQAIGWYNRAMSETDVGPSEASILYCNRAFCQLKKRDFAAAVASCDRATELDAGNEKAWHRRMLAYVELKDDSNVLMAGRKVLALNARNELAYRTVDRLGKELAGEMEVPINGRVFTSTLDGLGADVPFIRKRPHSKSTTALKRIQIRIPAAVVAVESNDADLSSVSSTTNETTSHIDMDFIEKADLSPEFEAKRIAPSASSVSFVKTTKDVENAAIRIDGSAATATATSQRPKNPIEFHRDWLSLRSGSQRYEYLKQIPPQELDRLIGSQLDGDMLSGVLLVLAEEFVAAKHDAPVEYLLALTRCKELAVLGMMLSEEDRRALATIIKYTNMRHENTMHQIAKAFTI